MINKTAGMSKAIVWLIFSCFAFPFFSSYSQELSDQNSLSDKSKSGYYLRLLNEEFIQMMVPKEKFLLDLARNVNEEIKERQLQGIKTLDLGIDQAVSPKTTLLDLFVQELDRIVRLSNEITNLERKARQKADMAVLESLSGLKKQVQEILERKSLSRDTLQTPIENSIPDQPKMSDETSVGTDLFDEWKYNQILDYKTKQTLYLYIRTRLFNTASPEQKKRMFQRDLRTALEHYSAGDYAVARLELGDVLDRYGHDRVLDDVHFYAAESGYALNYLDEALGNYRQLVTRFPESSFKAKSLAKILYIDYLYKNQDLLFADYQALIPCQNQLDPESFGAVSYLVGLAYFKSKDFTRAIACLTAVSSNSSMNFPAMYLSAVCQSNLGLDEEALAVYHKIADQESRGNKDPVLMQVKNNVLLKLGLIYYERGENRRAISLLNRVTQDYQFYDLSLLGKAWSAYRSGRPFEALENAERLLNHSLFSSYAYEAKVLAARSKELLGQKDAAIDDLKQVYQAGSSVGTLERESRTLQQIETSGQIALDNQDQELFAEADRIRRFLVKSNTATLQQIPFKINDLSLKTRKWSDQIRLLDSLETEAKTGEKKEQLDQIQKLKSEMMQTIQDQSGRVFAGLKTDDPLIRRMGMANYLRYLFGNLLRETLDEKDETRKNIREATLLAEETRKENKTRLSVLMEIQQEELEDYLKKLNQYEIWLRENFPQEFRVDLDYWASFSEYGISNINFMRIKEIDTRISDISKTMGLIDKLYYSKRIEFEKRIQGLLNDVAQIEKQMRQEEEKRKQAEQERFFKNEYFERQKTESKTGQLKEKPDLDKGKNP